MHPFRKYILNYNTLNEDEWQLIEKCLSRKHYKKGDVILESGKICRKLYFLEEGFLKFYVFRDGEKVSKFFTEAPYCFTSQRSFTTDTPTNDNIEALQDSVVWEMSKEKAFQLLELPHWSEFVRKLIQEVQFYTEQILEEAQNNTAEERYKKLVEEKSSILENAPLKDIASYLGIAPQSLSRIRKKYWTDQRKLT
ncbi:MAG: Crp/Fnr family transcriptional regulator [Winogradskyella sp.]|uniref:Crp/Fnr family transcriptional regulator n=1 Tax=Winogradskyella sp. TaxID=1883156 RepID=UPI000F3E189C|nr:Crp/Fnr family transcriptional regulator [Winogradskyella sp.]RNC87857.1 MAG: Crp/Fnr family transcriptional regulator [Winogradskyella sp.]